MKWHGANRHKTHDRLKSKCIVFHPGLSIHFVTMILDAIIWRTADVISAQRVNETPMNARL